MWPEAALGTTLRQQASRAAALKQGADEKPTVLRGEAISTIHPPRLAKRTRLGGSLLVIAALGAIAGGLLGGVFLASADWQLIHPAGIFLGALSSAVLGGFLGFLLSSFLSVSGSALAKRWASAIRRRRPAGQPPKLLQNRGAHGPGRYRRPAGICRKYSAVWKRTTIAPLLLLWKCSSPSWSNTSTSAEFADCRSRRCRRRPPLGYLVGYSQSC